MKKFDYIFSKWIWLTPPTIDLTYGYYMWDYPCCIGREFDISSFEDGLHEFWEGGNINSRTCQFWALSTLAMGSSYFCCYFSHTSSGRSFLCCFYSRILIPSSTISSATPGASHASPKQLPIFVIFTRRREMTPLDSYFSNALKSPTRNQFLGVSNFVNPPTKPCCFCLHGCTEQRWRRTIAKAGRTGRFWFPQAVYENYLGKL